MKSQNPCSEIFLDDQIQIKARNEITKEWFWVADITSWCHNNCTTQLVTSGERDNDCKFFIHREDFKNGVLFFEPQPWFKDVDLIEVYVLIRDHLNEDEKTPTQTFKLNEHKLKLGVRDYIIT